MGSRPHLALRTVWVIFLGNSSQQGLLGSCVPAGISLFGSLGLLGILGLFGSFTQGLGAPG
jgi:hypothetical protein